ncbi:MAG: hypothetical protein H7Y27_16800 [Gemmatimonadaceae bacterium]|nr:hypothetical protein [Chitinophagaceae bacterium]
MENLPVLLYAGFILTLFATLYFFFRAARWARWLMVGTMAWTIVQGIVSATGFYEISDTLPPRFALLLGPPLILMAISFLTRSGKRWIDGLSLRTLTILHVIRVPVELILFTIFLHKGIPEMMTFEGRNLDILSGISAPLVYYFGLVKKKLNKTIILAWNFICLGLLINIVGIAILTAPFRFQQFGFEQPNIAVLQFPFTWLPAVIVPIVLFSHLVSIRRLTSKSNTL